MAIDSAISFSTLTAAEIAVLQAIVAGTYFVDNEVPSGTINSSNVTFTTANAPNPADSLKVFINGMRMKGGGADYSLSGSTITTTVAPPTGSLILIDYINSPV